MAKTTIGFGLLLVAVGIGAYFGTGSTSWTALIPSLFGAVLTVLGLIACSPRWRKHAIHVALIVAVLGIVGSAMRVIKAMGAEDFEWRTAVVMQIVMAVICIVFVIMGIASFVKARRSPAGPV